ncbi:MAG: chemotaxis protein CheD [Bacteroidales bacterium]|nr:chemotaxis protein CheD [Bacteroidales bacterium]
MHNTINRYYLHPSSVVVCNRPTEIITLLGSCVAVCLWDPVKEFGGINHFMLPLWNGQGLASPKYGDIATEKLITKMIKLGSNKQNIEAKLFGGASVLFFENNFFNIGERNIETAKKVLERNRIQVISSSTGGTMGRKILFNTNTGAVRQKYIRKKLSS